MTGMRTRIRHTVGWTAAVALAAVVAPGRAQDAVRTVPLSEIEEHGERYAGETVRVSGEVQTVLGPRLFTIDEDEWFDFDGETVVYVPAPLVALVRANATVTVAGIVHPMAAMDVIDELGWYAPRPGDAMEYGDRPMILANTVLGDDGAVLTIGGETSADGVGAPLMDLDQLVYGDADIVGRPVDLTGVPVIGQAKAGAFWVSREPQENRVGNQDRLTPEDVAPSRDLLFVIPRKPPAETPAAGARVNITGVVLELPKRVRRDLGGQLARGEVIYVYASQISAAGE